jgi:hypothetical protein
VSRLPGWVEPDGHTVRIESIEALTSIEGSTYSHTELTLTGGGTLTLRMARCEVEAALRDVTVCSG